MALQDLRNLTNRKPLTLVELKLDKCALTYGVGNCRAVMEGNALTYSILPGSTLGWTNLGLSGVDQRGGNGAGLLSPEGRRDFTVLYEGGVTGEHRTSQTVKPILTDNTTHTFSCYLRALGRDRAALSFVSKANALFRADFLLTGAGTVTSVSGGATATITSLPNSWYRCTISMSSGSGATTPSVRINLLDGSGAISYAPSFGSIRVFGPQLTATVGAVQYAPTRENTRVPHLSKCYNTFLTCRDPEQFDTGDVDFSTSNYLQHNGSNHGIAANTQYLVISFGFRPDINEFITTNGVIFQAISISALRTRFFILYNPNTGVLTIQGFNTAGSLVVSYSSGTSIGIGYLSVTVLINTSSVDGNISRVYVNDKLTGTFSQTANSLIDLAGCTSWQVGDSFLSGQMSHFAMWAGLRVKAGQVSARRAFVRSGGAPEQFGEDGSATTGAVPQIYLRGPADKFRLNRGSGSDFVVVNALSMPPAPFPGSGFLLGTKVAHLFSEANSDLPAGLHAFPCIDPGNVTLAPTVLAPDKGLGQRASLTVKLRDFPYHDIGIDPYLDERGFDQEAQGTFFGRLLARQRISIINRPVTVLVGYNDGTFDEANFERRQYEVDRIDGPDAKGDISLVAKDPLKRIIERKAQAPFPSKGSLASDITSVSTSASLLPAGIGNSDYPTSGHVRIGQEVCSFTRSADTLTLVRARYNTVAEAHEAGDLVQLCLEYVGQRPGDLVYDLITTYGGVPPRYIDKNEWDAEVDSFIIRLYSALITQPTPVDTLVKELTEQTPTYIWWDERFARIRYRAMKAPSVTPVLIDEATGQVADSLKGKEEQELRVSQVWVFFGIFNPTKTLTDPTNFSNLYVNGDLESESDPAYGTPSIKKIFSRWIESLNKPAAEDITKNLLARYSRSPRTAELTVDAKDAGLWTGDLFTLTSRVFQTETGLPEQIVMQVMEARDKVNGHSVTYKGQEYKAAVVDNVRRIIIASDYVLDPITGVPGINIRTAHDRLYGPPEGPVEVEVIVESGVILGSASPFTPALTRGVFPTGSTIKVFNYGRIQGAGGKGGQGGRADAGGNYIGDAGDPGEKGGDAIDSSAGPITLQVVGEIFAGGGGGGGGGSGNDGGDAHTGSGGGGGQGFTEKVGSSRIGGRGGPSGGYGDDGIGIAGADATSNLPGAGGTRTSDGQSAAGGNGGAAGVAGASGQSSSAAGGVGGAAGRAIVGVTNVTFVGSGTIIGAQI